MKTLRERAIAAYEERESGRRANAAREVERKRATLTSVLRKVGIDTSEPGSSWKGELWYPADMGGLHISLGTDGERAYATRDRAVRLLIPRVGTDPDTALVLLGELLDDEPVF